MKSKTLKGLNSFFIGAIDTVINTTDVVGTTIGNTFDTVLETGENIANGELAEAPLTLVKGTFGLVGDAVEGTFKIAGSVIDTAHGAVKTATGIPKDVKGAARELGKKIGGERGEKVADILTFDTENDDDEVDEKK